MGNSVPVVGDCVCYEGAENRSPEQLKRNRRRTLALLRRTGFRHSEEVSMARERLKARARERREKREALHAQLAEATGVGSGSEEPSKFREQFIREAQEMRHTNYLLACDGYNMRVQIKALEDARAAEKVAAKAEKEFTLSLEISTLTVRDYVEGQTRLSLEFELSCGGTCIIDADWMRDAQKDSVTYVRGSFSAALRFSATPASAPWRASTRSRLCPLTPPPPLPTPSRNHRHGSNERFTILQLREPRLLVWTLPESVMVEWDGVLHVRLAVDSEPQLACWLFVLSDLDEVPTVRACACGGAHRSLSSPPPPLLTSSPLPPIPPPPHTVRPALAASFDVQPAAARSLARALLLRPRNHRKGVQRWVRSPLRRRPSHARPRAWLPRDGPRAHVLEVGHAEDRLLRA